MFCIKCGQPNDPQARFCASCGAPIGAGPQPPAPAPPSYAAPAGPFTPTAGVPPIAGATHYAGFWRRFAAMLIDGLLLSIVIFPAVMILGGAFGLAAAPMGDIEGSPVAAAMGGTLFLLFMIIGIGLPWLYEALMVSSSKQATLGKLLLGIVVTDLAGNRVSFARASGRYFGKILSQMVLYIGFLMAAFTEKKQALHDMIAGCLVLVRQ